VVPAAAAVSLAMAVVRARDRIRRYRGPRPLLSIGDIAGLLIICVVIVIPTSYVLHAQHTVGPVGYAIADVDNYVGTQDAAQQLSLHDARRLYDRYVQHGMRPGNASHLVWGVIVNVDSNLDATPLDANVNALLGLGATGTWAPFLIALQLAGALGAFALARYLAESWTWIAVLAGAMFGGAFFIELWFDTFQAALIALGVLMPLAILSLETMRSPRPGNILLTALVFGTLFTVYPLYVPEVAAAAGVVLLWRALSLRRAGEPLRAPVKQTAIAIIAIVIIAIVTEPVAFVRDVHYWSTIANNTVALPRLGFNLPPDVVPGWVAQTREFWDMPHIGTGGFWQFVTGAVLPLLFAGVIVFGLRRHPLGVVLVVLAAVFAVAAVYSYYARDRCTYCAERNLLPLAPIVAVLLAVGLAAMFAMPSHRMKALAIAGVVIAAMAVSVRARVELHRFQLGAYFLDTRDRIALSHLPPGRGRVELENYGASAYAAFEQPLVYHLVNEISGGRASIMFGNDQYGGLAYLYPPPHAPPGPEFDPSYRYVLTRTAAVQTDRRLIARAGGIALQERIRPLDITPFGGIGIPLDRIDPSGQAWVQTNMPLEFWINGSNGGRPAWARLMFTTREPVRVVAPPFVRSALHGNSLTVCARATGSEPIRKVRFRISAAPYYVPAPVGYARPMPLEGVALTSMRAVTGGCRT
jgi:hypothetical protein